MKTVKVGVLGLGTVSRGAVEILATNATEISRRCGADIQVTHAVVRDQSKARAYLDEQGYSITLMDDASALVTHADVDIVCEAMGGMEPARTLLLQALSAGKHVVTANKALIALHGNELFQCARDNKVSVLFEPAVAGGIPIIKAVREGLAANRIESLAGIINGTGNFILSEMSSKGREFAEVLAEAQALGYAEADPSFDVDGIDAAHKITILASMAFGIPLQFERTLIEGISSIDKLDVGYAAELGYVIKHLGVARRRDEGIEVRVHPTLIPSDKLIANVNGVLNAVLVQGDAVGSTLYSGAGAGGGATGSAVVADIIDIARAMPGALAVPPLAFEDLEATPVLEASDYRCRYYLRAQVQDRPGVIAEISRILGDAGISIQALLQHPSEDKMVPVVLLTGAVREGDLAQALARIAALDVVSGTPVRLRVEHFD